MGDHARRAAIVGTGLIGGSIGLALKARGWHVTGWDRDPAHSARALALGAIDSVGSDSGGSDSGGSDSGGSDSWVEVTFIATPVSAVVPAALRALSRASAGVVTDVAGVKAPILAALGDPRFVGGHPMAGSEQEGVEGADPDLFAGATWVLTPTSATSAEAFVLLRAVISSLGAVVIAVAPEAHDTMVALVSHVPHLAAVTLMGLAADGAGEGEALFRLAAGGFRDMTRVASGHPGIWPDICTENREAILATLDRLTSALSGVREMVASGSREDLLATLERARLARRSLPSPVTGAQELVEVRVPVADRPGALAEVTTLAGALGVNIDDLVLTHSGEGDRGVLILVIDASSVGRVRQGLLAAGFHPSSGRPLD